MTHPPIADEMVERLADTVLKAAGTGLRYYTQPNNRGRILTATRAALEAALSGKEE